MTYSPEQISRISSLNGSRCGECCQKVIIYKYCFNKALLDFLGIIVKHVQGSTINWFKTSELSPTRSQYTNGTKLKYWGLIAHSDDKLKWCLTPLGYAFYFGNALISDELHRYDNHSWGASETKVLSDQIDPSLQFSESWARVHNTVQSNLTLDL